MPRIAPASGTIGPKLLSLSSKVIFFLGRCFQVVVSSSFGSLPANNELMFPKNSNKNPRAYFWSSDVDI